MPPTSLLHVTDLHINDPNSANEHLRVGYYDEYLADLVRAVHAAGVEDVHALIATGDFVDVGKVANFPHAKNVIHKLADLLRIPHQQVAVCPGNHDVNRPDEKKGDLEAARAAFRSFAETSGNSQATFKNLRASCGVLYDKLWFLMLDSTIGAEGENRAGRFEDQEVDEIMRWIKGIPVDEALIVASHHPVDTYIAHSSAFDDPTGDWAQKHIWWEAAKLRERIKKERAGGVSVWLCGDIHRHGQFIEGAIAFCTAGRLGVTTSASHGEVRRQATLLQIGGDQPITGIRFEYEVEGGMPAAHAGSWTHTPIAFTRIIKEIPVPTPVPRPLVDSTAPPVLEIIDPDFQRELINAISGNELYRFGRFVTGGDTVSLAWVSIGPLLGTGNTLEAVLSRMARWTETRILNDGSLQPENVVLLGLDCWGAVFASQISIVTGTRAFCTSLRGDGAHSAPEESLNPALAAEILDAKAVVLVTDVVASGRSLRRAREEIMSAAKQPSALRWFAISLMCDAEQDRGDMLDFVESHGTLCADLRMPLMSRHDLPEEDVLVPTLSFR